MGSWAPPLATVRARWADAPADDAELTDLLDAAQEALEQYAPALVDPATGAALPVPARYRRALGLHAREVHQAATRNGDMIGFDTYAVRARELTPTVKGLLRPQPGVPVIG